MALVILLGYAIGSVPFALLLARRWGAPDLRTVGSGNLGAANVLRASGVTAGILVAVLDIAKGALSVTLARYVSDQAAAPAAAGLAAIVGHIYPIWLRFRGGKGVATACGVFSVLTPFAMVPALTIFALTVWVTKYISLGSVLATLALAAHCVRHRQPAVRRWLAACAAATLIVFRHRSNLARLQLGAGTAAWRRVLRDASCERAMPMSAIGVLGAGSWGTALAVHLARVGHDVRLWARDPALVHDMRVRRANAVYLPDVTLPDVALRDRCDRGGARRHATSSCPPFPRTGAAA